MVNKILPVIFLALGLLLICSGIFHSFLFKQEQKVKGNPSTPAPHEVYDTFTLENDRYEGEYSPQTEFRNLNEADSALLLKEQKPTVTPQNEAGFAREFDLLDQATEEKSSGAGILPAAMAFSGAFFLTFGVVLIRRGS